MKPIVTSSRICPSGSHRLCPTPELCLLSCNLQTAEGGRTFDSAVHEAPPVRRPAPIQFEPDYGGRRVPPRWYKRIPIFRWCTAAGVALITFCAVAGFVLRAVNQFNH